MVTIVQREEKASLLKKLGLFSLLFHTVGASRYWEIDALRGVAIVMMVIYHFAYDLTLFGYYQANVFVGPWRVFARVTAILFIGLAGGSLALGYARARQRERGRHLYKDYLTRGLKLIGWGMVITLVTWAYMGKPVVIFGILHLIGASTILAYPFLSLRWPSLAIGVGMIALGIYLNGLPISHPWLLLLGLRPRSLFQLDYFPLLPWFGVALLGVFASHLLYSGGTRQFDLPSPPGPLSQNWERGWGVRALTWLGQRSLAIYLAHQPVLFTLFTLANVIGVRDILS